MFWEIEVWLERRVYVWWVRRGAGTSTYQSLQLSVLGFVVAM